MRHEARSTMSIAEVPFASEGHNRPRNPGARLDAAWFESVGVNASAVERRAATLTTRRSVKKEYQAAWLVKALTCIDLTTLAGDDTPGRVRRLCAKARRPLRDDLLDGAWPRRCAPDRRRRLRLSDHGRARGRGARRLGIPVASVATGFPAGLTPLQAAARRDPLCGRRRARARSTSSSPARMC